MYKQACLYGKDIKFREISAAIIDSVRYVIFLLQFNFRHFIRNLMFIIAFSSFLESVMEKRKCYQCEVTDLALCTDEYLLPCPDNQAYDSCMTRISKTSTAILVTILCSI